MLVINNSLEIPKKQNFSNKLYVNQTEKSKTINKQSLSTPSADLLKAYYLPKKNAINFTGIKITHIASEFVEKEADLIKEIEKFDEVGNNARKLGTGLWAEAFKFRKLPFVIKKFLKSENELPAMAKKALNDNGDEDFFDMEMTGMEYAAKALPDTQRFVAKAISDEGVKYLLTTMVKGKDADPATNPWTKKHFKSLFNKMFKLDKNGIYQGDLNGGNIKLTNNGDANLLDYQWTTKVDPIRFFEENENQEFPRFRYLENDQMFKMSGLPSYLKKVDDNQVEGVFTDYLKGKSEYHKNRKELLEGLLPDWKWGFEKDYIKKAIDFEDVQSQLFKEPTSDVLKVEAQKLDMEAAMRTGFSQTDKMITENNLLAGPTAQFFALHSMRRFKYTLNDMKKNPNSDVMGRYLNHQLEEVDYWISKQKKKVEKAFHFIKEDINYDLPILKDREVPLKDFGSSPFLGPRINSKLGFEHDSGSRINMNQVSMYGEIYADLHKENKELFRTRNPEVLNLKKDRDEIKTAFYMSASSVEKNRFLDCLTSNIYGMFCAKNYQNKLDNISKSKIHPIELKNIEKEQKVAKKLFSKFETLTNYSFDNITYYYNRYNIASYKGMNDFNVGINQRDINIADSNYDLYTRI